MTNPPVTSSLQWIKGVLRVFASEGIEIPALLEAADIDPHRLQLSHERFNLTEVNRLWEAAVKMSGNPALGLDRVQVSRHVNFSLSAQPMGSSPDLRTGLETLAHYLDLIHDTANFALEPQGRDAWLTITHADPKRIPRQRTEFGLLVLLVLCRRVTRHKVKALGAEFMSAAPADFHPYRMAFECPMRFGQPINRILLGQADLALPVIAAHSPFAVQERVLEKRLRQRTKAPTRYRASQEIVLRLSLGEPRGRATARALGLSEAEMASRLKAENTSFDALLDELRRELAQGYLDEPSIPMARIPLLLGYETARELTEACQRWFGTTPTILRQHHQEAELHH
ncbi:MAG: AraC family transcriptional regulator ligand-binding domain-containing protein [Ramlibacter sp.]|nr:AraC family transcriptional regulator ligand-binding domain-containing protein [Ramlibacter sp.]